jgi:Tfp pilus assembly PilM family ATPase/Tfp pilus assembly protein PilN
LLYLQQSLGIDFRDRTLRIVHLGRTFKGIVLIDYFLKKYPPPPSPAGKSGVEGEPDPLALDLRNFIREKGIKPEQIVVGLPKEKVILKEILLPKIEEKQLQEILEYEVEKHVPFTSESISFDYQILRKEDNALKVLLGIVKKDELQKVLNLLDLEQTKPFVVDITSIAGMNWLISRNGLSENSITAFVDIGADRVDLSLLAGKEIRITRSFNRIENRLEDPYIVEDVSGDDIARIAGEPTGAAGTTGTAGTAGPPTGPVGTAGTTRTDNTAAPSGAAGTDEAARLSGVSGISGNSGIDDAARPAGLVQSWLENKPLDASSILPPSSIIPPFPMVEEGQDEEIFPDPDKDLFPALQQGAEDPLIRESRESLEPIDESVRALGQDIIRELDIALNVFTDFQGERAIDIDNVILTGTEAYSGLLSEYINAQTGVQVRILNPLKNIKTKVIPGKISSSLSAATGLALRGLEEQPLMLNFLAEGKKIKRKTNHVVVTVAFMALVIILSLAWVLGLSYEGTLISSELTRRLKSLQPDVTEVKNISQEVEKVDKELSMIEKVSDTEISKMEIMKELTTILPADTWLDNVDVSNEKLEINGYSESASNLIPMLEISPLFEGVQFGSSITKMGQGKERFKIKANIERGKSADSSGKEKESAGKEKISGPETVKGSDLEKKLAPATGKGPDQGIILGHEAGKDTGKEKNSDSGKKGKP